MEHVRLFFNISLLFHYGCFLEQWEEDAGEAASNFYAVVCCKAICFSLPFQVPEEKKNKTKHSVIHTRHTYMRFII